PPDDGRFPRLPRPSSRTRGSATPDCRNCPPGSGIRTFSAPRAGPPGWWRNNRGKSATSLTLSDLEAVNAFHGGRLNLVELRLLAGRAALVLAPGNFLHLSAADQVGQTDAAEEFMDAIAQIAPQVMSETGVTRMAVTLPLATGGVHRFIDRIDDFGDL